MIASVGQGRELRDQAIRSAGGATSPSTGSWPLRASVPFGDAKLTVVAPTRRALGELDG